MDRDWILYNLPRKETKRQLEISKEGKGERKAKEAERTNGQRCYFEGLIHDAQAAKKGCKLKNCNTTRFATEFSIGKLELFSKSAVRPRSVYSL